MRLTSRGSIACDRVDVPVIVTEASLQLPFPSNFSNVSLRRPERRRRTNAAWEGTCVTSYPTSADPASERKPMTKRERKVIIASSLGTVFGLSKRFTLDLF